MSDENVYYYNRGEEAKKKTGIGRVCDKTITKVVIASGVTKINAGAFEGCKKLQSVEFEEPHQVKEIAYYAFAWCEALETIELPESLLKIGPCAFANCYALRRIVIPGRVTSLGRKIFEESGIEEIVLSDGLESAKDRSNIPGGAFGMCKRLHTVRFPASVKEIQAHEFCACENLENVIIPADGFPLLKRLDLFSFYESRRWEAMCKIAQKAPNVTSLSLSYVTVEFCKLGDRDIPLVIEMVSSCPHLESLDLSYNAFSHQAIRTLDSRGVLCRLRHVDLRYNRGTGSILSSSEFLTLLQRNPRLAILTSHEWENPEDEFLISHYLDMNRYGCRGVPIRHVSTWPRLIDRLGTLELKHYLRIDELETCPANVLFHLLREGTGHPRVLDLVAHQRQQLQVLESKESMKETTTMKGIKTQRKIDGK